MRFFDMNALRSLLTTPDLDRHVVRLHLELTVSLSEEGEVERIPRDLQGTDATHGRVGVLIVDRAGLQGPKWVQATLFPMTSRRYSKTPLRDSRPPHRRRDRRI